MVYIPNCDIINAQVNYMRYLGNKESIIDNITNLIQKKKIKNNSIFCDAFCGTGTVANSVKNNFKIVLNDNLKLATTFSKGRIYKGHCFYNDLGFNPIDFFNNNENVSEGFFSR